MNYADGQIFLFMFASKTKNKFHQHKNSREQVYNAGMFLNTDSFLMSVHNETTISDGHSDDRYRIYCTGRSTREQRDIAADYGTKKQYRENVGTDCAHRSRD